MDWMNWKREILEVARLLAMVLLLAVGFVGSFCVPDEGLDAQRWLVSLVVSKAVGFGSLWLAARLFVQGLDEGGGERR